MLATLLLKLGADEKGETGAKVATNAKTVGDQGFANLLKLLAPKATELTPSAPKLVIATPNTTAVNTIKPAKYTSAPSLETTQTTQAAGTIKPAPAPAIANAPSIDGEMLAKLLQTTKNGNTAAKPTTTKDGEILGSAKNDKTIVWNNKATVQNDKQPVVHSEAKRLDSSVATLLQNDKKVVQNDKTIARNEKATVENDKVTIQNDKQPVILSEAKYLDSSVVALPQNDKKTVQSEKATAPNDKQPVVSSEAKRLDSSVVTLPQNDKAVVPNDKTADKPAIVVGEKPLFRLATTPIEPDRIDFANKPAQTRDYIASAYLADRKLSAAVAYELDRLELAAAAKEGNLARLVEVANARGLKAEIVAIEEGRIVADGEPLLSQEAEAADVAKIAEPAKSAKTAEPTPPSQPAPVKLPIARAMIDAVRQNAQAAEKSAQIAPAIAKEIATPIVAMPTVSTPTVQVKHAEIPRSAHNDKAVPSYAALNEALRSVGNPRSAQEKPTKIDEILHFVQNDKASVQNDKQPVVLSVATKRLDSSVAALPQNDKQPVILSEAKYLDSSVATLPQNDKVGIHNDKVSVQNDKAVEPIKTETPKIINEAKPTPIAQNDKQPVMLRSEATKRLDSSVATLPQNDKAGEILRSAQNDKSVKTPDLEIAETPKPTPIAHEKPTKIDEILRFAQNDKVAVQNEKAIIQNDKAGEELQKPVVPQTLKAVLEAIKTPDRETIATLKKPSDEPKAREKTAVKDGGILSDAKNEKAAVQNDKQPVVSSEAKRLDSSVASLPQNDKQPVMLSAAKHLDSSVATLPQNDKAIAHNDKVSVQNDKTIVQNDKTADDPATNENSVIRADAFGNEKVIAKFLTARASVNHFAARLNEAIENYKPPISRITIEMQPESLGTVSVTITSRGRRLDVALNATESTIALLKTTQGEFRQNLARSGFADVTVRFADSDGAPAHNAATAQNTPNAQNAANGQNQHGQPSAPAAQNAQNTQNTPTAQNQQNSFDPSGDRRGDPNGSQNQQNNQHESRRQTPENGGEFDDDGSQIGTVFALDKQETSLSISLYG